MSDMTRNVSGLSDFSHLFFLSGQSVRVRFVAAGSTRHGGEWNQAIAALFSSIHCCFVLYPGCIPKDST